MAIFQGENLAFKIILKDDSNNILPTSSIHDINAKLYNETSKKLWVAYQLTSAASTQFTRLIVDDTDGFLFNLTAEDSAIMPPGRYIIQIDYDIVDTDFNEADGGYKKSMQKGALVSILKSL